jgi:hypothetical protein
MTSLLLFVFFILAGIGITSICVDSEFFRGWKENFGKWVKGRIEKYGEDNWLNKILRKIHYMIYCYQCSGFWVGLILGILMDPLCQFQGWKSVYTYVAFLAYGGVVSYLTQMGMALYNYINVEYGPRK